jgi:hypothetical protein
MQTFCNLHILHISFSRLLAGFMLATVFKANLVDANIK